MNSGNDFWDSEAYQNVLSRSWVSWIGDYLETFYIEPLQRVREEILEVGC